MNTRFSAPRADAARRHPLGAMPAARQSRFRSVLNNSPAHWRLTMNRYPLWKYLLIAGTYTPFMLVSLRHGNGVVIMSVVWGLALLGVLSEIFLSGRAVKVGQMLIYLAMGWACSLDMAELRGAISTPAFNWLLAGGLAYTGGVVFYVLDKMGVLRHSHGIWHIFVLAGSICHFISIIGYIR